MRLFEQLGIVREVSDSLYYNHDQYFPSSIISLMWFLTLFSNHNCITGHILKMVWEVVPNPNPQLLLPPPILGP